MATKQGMGLTTKPPTPRMNAGERRWNNQQANQRVNATERRMINTGQMQAPPGYQGGQGQAPQQPQQRPPMPQQPPQMGGGAQMQPMPRPNFQNPKQFAPGQMPQMPWGQGGMQGQNPFQGFSPMGQGQQFMPYGGQPPQGQPGIQYNGGSQQQPQSNFQGMNFQGMSPYFRGF